MTIGAQSLPPLPPVPVPEVLLNCDLSILAYQLYHQSVIWPLDPWYEVLARGATDRRANFMKQVHAYAQTLPARSDKSLYAGPASVGGIGKSSATHDPVLSNYSQIRPRDPAFSGDGAVFIAIQAPSYLVDPIKVVSVSRHTGAWVDQFPYGPLHINLIHDYGDGKDELVAFEGGTGSYKDSDASWSMMGFVLKRTRADAKWDAHIVFRGSRSGNATRALIGATAGPFNGPAGNADWVTDMASELKQDDTIGGAVAVGFAASLKRCLGPLHHALQHLHQKYGAPHSVQVTGHSLGAALANICTAALTSGSAEVQLAKRLPDWPTASVRGYFMALPPVGTEAFCDAFKQRMGDRASAPYVADDPVVECSKSVSLTKTAFMGWLGARMGSGGYTAGKLDRMPRPDGTVSGENSHEIYLIRTAIVKKLADARTQVPQTISAATPWATYITFADMLDGKAVSHFVGDAPKIVTRENLRRVLVNYRFAEHFASFLDLLKAIVADPKAYRGVHGDMQYQLAAERVALALDMAGKIDSKDAAGIADNVATQVAALLAFHVKKEFVQKGWKVVREAVKDQEGGVALQVDELLGESFNTRIGLGMILRTLQEKTNTSITDYEKYPELELCLNVQLPDVSDWQLARVAKYIKASRTAT